MCICNDANHRADSDLDHVRVITVSIRLINVMLIVWIVVVGVFVLK